MMKQPIAKNGDGIGPVMDAHTVLNTVTSVTQQLQFPFNGNFNPATLESKVRVNGNAVATINSEVINTPLHVPPPSCSFTSPPSNIGEIVSCNVKVLVNGKKVAKAKDPCRTCTEVPQTPGPEVVVRNEAPVYIGTPS
jgi:uncharacterized Zn-binding protein involved in type VI secretion